jgi:hypothetical protein
VITNENETEADCFGSSLISNYRGILSQSILAGEVTMTVSISELWLGILLASVFCWVASSLIHMLFKYHNGDYKELGNEDDVATALRASTPAPALYTLPHCADMKGMGEEAMQQKFKLGPVAMITILPNGMPPMGRLLAQQILFFLAGTFLIAYLGSMALFSGAEFMTVFRFMFVASFLCYGWAQIPYSIWMGQPWSNCIRYLIDAIIYAAVTAATLAWWWPSMT